jgi:hypothetical protein
MFTHMESVKDRRKKFMLAVSYGAKLIVDAQRPWNFLISRCPSGAPMDRYLTKRVSNG